MNMPAKILFLAPVHFSRLKQRHQSFAIDLARRGFVLSFVEPLISPGFSVTVEHIMPNLQVLKVKVPFKATSFRGLQNVCAKFALSAVLRHTSIVPQQTLLWVAEPSLAAFVGKHWQTVVYDRCDLHGSFPGQRQQAWQAYERLLCDRADLITVSHPYLALNLPDTAAEKIVLAANACSEDFLRNTSMDGLISREPGRRQAMTAGPVKFVSSGAHYEWVDSDWLAMLSELEGVEMHIAGTGRGEAFERLIKRQNVTFHGHLNHEQLLRLLQNCHVGLIPFKNLDLIKGVDPIKAYEYAACGLELWAPDLLPLRSNNLIGRFVSDKAQALKALHSFKFSPSLFSGKIPVWSERVQTVLDRLQVLRSD